MCCPNRVGRGVTPAAQRLIQKTLKYQPDFPARFDSIEHARTFCQTFFAWYNDEHRHSGIGYMTPAAIHTATRSSSSINWPKRPPNAAAETSRSTLNSTQPV